MDRAGLSCLARVRICSIRNFNRNVEWHFKWSEILLKSVDVAASKIMFHVLFSTFWAVCCALSALSVSYPHAKKATRCKVDQRPLDHNVIIQFLDTFMEVMMCTKVWILVGYPEAGRQQQVVCFCPDSILVRSARNMRHVMPSPPQ